MNKRKGKVRSWFSLEDKPPCCEPHPIIEVDNLAITYASQTALAQVSLTINKGCITAVVGPSGCGKSSFLMALNRMTDLIPGCRVSGSIKIGSQSILDDKHDVVQLRRRVGMIFQKPSPFPLSIQRNLTFPLREHGVKDRDVLHATVEETLRAVGLWEEVKDRLGAPALTLSGGQQQRLCLARALALKPEVILLDEPCSALDPISSGVVEELIENLRGRYTIVVVTHNLAQARRIADEVVVFWLRDGCGYIVESGTTRRVFESPQSEVTGGYVAGLRG